LAIRPAHRDWSGRILEREIAETIVNAAPERPEGWIHRSFALHELNRTLEALNQLLPVAEEFPDQWTIYYNLACYCSQFGKGGIRQECEPERYRKSCFHITFDGELPSLLRRLLTLNQNLAGSVLCIYA